MTCVIYFSLPGPREPIYCCMADRAENHRQLLNSLEEAAVLLDRDGIVHHSNSMFRNLIGNKKPENKPLTELLPAMPEQWLRTSLEADEVSAFVFPSRVVGCPLLASVLPSDQYRILMIWKKEEAQYSEVVLSKVLQPTSLMIVDPLREPAGFGVLILHTTQVIQKLVLKCSSS